MSAPCARCSAWLARSCAEPACWPGTDTGLDQADGRPLAVDFEFVTDVAQEFDTGLRQRMLIADENCWRIELADSELDAWR